MTERIKKLYRTIKNPPITVVMSPLQRFIKQEATGSKILLACIVIGLIWANIPWGETYARFWNIIIGFSIGNDYWGIDIFKPLVWWINDGLMTIFFLLIGLELKREVLIGGLTSLKDSLTSIVGAFGGMVIPMALFMSINHPKSEGFIGWSIPVATDIAIAIGILALFSFRIPRRIKIMLTSMAIIDDLGAIFIIAIFYSAGIDWRFLLLVLFVVIMLLIFNRLGIRNLLAYIIPGITLWFFVFMSGIHPTIAGVLLAALIPATKRIDLCDFYDISEKCLDNISEISQGDTEDEVSCYNRVISQAHALEKGFQNIRAPIEILEHQILSWVVLLIVPLFALANSGVSFFELTTNPFTCRVFWGIIIGLIIGKPLGIFLGTFICKKTKLFIMPSNVKWEHILGMSFLMGIGFTMSSFLAGLSFKENAGLLSISKIGIIIGSFISGILGYLILRDTIKRTQRITELKAKAAKASGTPGSS